MTEEEKQAIRQVVDQLMAAENTASALNVADLDVMNTGYTVQDTIQHCYEELQEMLETNNDD
jgi:hypothetical protein